MHLRSFISYSLASEMALNFASLAPLCVRRPEEPGFVMMQDIALRHQAAGLRHCRPSAL